MKKSFFLAFILVSLIKSYAMENNNQSTKEIIAKITNPTSEHGYNMRVWWYQLLFIMKDPEAEFLSLPENKEQIIQQLSTIFGKQQEQVAKDLEDYNTIKKFEPNNEYLKNCMKNP